MVMTESRITLLMLSACFLLAACKRSEPILDSNVLTSERCITQDSEEQIALSCPQGRVVMKRSPFGLQFFDRSGQAVLGTVDNIDAGPAPLLAATSLPSGNQSLPAPLYAPISFAAGLDSNLQFPGSPFVGNILLRATTGIEFSATAILSSSRTETGGLSAMLATNDPSGRTLSIQIEPETLSPAFKVKIAFSNDAGVAVTSLSFASGEDESFFGFGGRRNAIDQSGEAFYNWLEQLPIRPDAIEPILSALPTVGPNTQIPHQAQSAYYVQTSFISSRPYGFWLETDHLSEFRLRRDHSDAWQARTAGAGTGFVVSLGSGAENISNLTAITGRNPVPAPWHLEPIFSRTLTGAPFKNGTDYYAEILDDLEHIESLNIPYEGFMFEGWPLLEQEGLYEKAIEAIRGKGLRPITYIRLFTSNDLFGYERQNVFYESVAQSYLATLPGGSLPYLVNGTFGPHSLMGVIDYTKPSALSWWESRITEILDSGVEGFMQDFGEQVFTDMQFASGEAGATLHNRLPVLAHRATREIFTRWQAKNPDRDPPLFFVRAGYSGRPGSAAYEGANWGGDNTTDWSRASGIGSVIPDMLNRSVGGAWAYHSDTGGLFDAFGSGTKELFIRWSWLATFTPLNRLHGGPINGLHTPWSFDEETVALYQKSLELRRAAQPLILELWKQSVKTGVPFVRPMWLIEPDWPSVARIDQQWMLGEDLLVAPVVIKGATSKRVFFPSGCWESPQTGERFNGPLENDVAAPLDQLPYFFRCGKQPFTPPA